jgi:adenosine deaminase
MDSLSFLNNTELTELHTHLGFSVSPTMLWEMAHDQGLKLPTKNYWEFEKLVTMYETKPFAEYLMMYDLTEKIQSSPEALFTASETAVSGAYRKNNITTLELRFNPILRARGGERDLDHLIVYALQGAERAMLKYPVKVGIILMMDRRLSNHENEAIVKKAIKYKTRGVVGIDLAGPVDGNENSRNFKPAAIADIVELARREGLGITVHTGEATDVKEMWEVVKLLKPDRIGHGIAAVHDIKLMQYLVEHSIVLETCPTSNLNTRLVRDFTEMRHIYKTFMDHKILFTINTDGPEMQKISLRGEYEKLRLNDILTETELLKANSRAKAATFIGRTHDKGKIYFV